MGLEGKDGPGQGPPHHSPTVPVCGTWQPLGLAERMNPHCHHKNGLQEPAKDCQFLADATWTRANASSGQGEAGACSAAAGLVLQRALAHSRAHAEACSADAVW